MTTLAIRQKLSAYLQVADDKKVKGMYALLEDDIKMGESVSIQQYNKEIDEAEMEYERGDFITHEAMLNEIKKW